MYNTGFFKFKTFTDKYGSLVAVEQNKDVPFEIKRIYYIYNVDTQVRRGFHSHIKLHQALICVKGSVKILVKTDSQEETILLDKPNEALYIGPMVWREMYDFSEDAVLLVLASDYYDESDYIRNWDKYYETATRYFK